MELNVEEGSIVTQTRKGNNIKNNQDKVPPVFGQLLEVRDLKQKHPFVTLRGKINSLYNCHGMTFASKRTGIYELPELNKILIEDEYWEVDLKDILPGDIVLYYSEQGDIEHSGFVIDVNDNGHIRTPKIISKWGPTWEVIHFIQDCPYDSSNLKYYRND